MTFKESHHLEVGGASNHTGGVLSLAFRVREAGSSYDKSCKHPKPTFRVASLNVGTLKKRSSEIVETLTRRRVDICSVQEHRWAGGIEANQTRLMKGKNPKYKFNWCCPDVEKEQFYDLLQEIVSKVPNSEVLIPIGDWNGHVGRVADGFEAAHGGFGYGNHSIEGERLFEFAVAKVTHN